MQQHEFRTGVIRPVECFKEGWELIKDQYWMIFAITLVGMLIASVIPFGIGMGAMFCGVYYCLFQKMRGHAVDFEGVFKGFNYFVPGLVASLVLIVPAIISFVGLYASMFVVMFASTDARGRIDESFIFAMLGTMFVEMIIIWLVLGTIHVFLLFAYPLIVERNLGGWDAFKLSARAAWANLGGAVGLIAGEFVLGLVGYLCLGVGLYFVMPVLFAGVLVAYRKVFPPPAAGEANYYAPPRPDIYQ